MPSLAKVPGAMLIFLLALLCFLLTVLLLVNSVCIFAAGICRTQGAVTMGGFVRGSKEVWNSTLKHKHWEPDDYHGNFDARKFERWFENLCQTLLQSCGGCNIHMDGASYHKRQTNEAPTMKKKTGLKSSNGYEKNGKGYNLYCIEFRN